MTVSELKAWRKLRLETQSEFAAFLGLTVNYYNSIERGHVTIPMKVERKYVNYRNRQKHS